MKKIITFLFCTAVISSAFAQTDNQSCNEKNTNSDYYNNSMNYQYGDKQYDYKKDFGYYHNDEYQNIINQRDEEIQKVNYQNEWQVHQIVNNCDLNIWEKRDILNNLESQRIQNINNIYDRYSNTIAYYRNTVRNNPFERQHYHDDDRR